MSTLDVIASPESLPVAFTTSPPVVGNACPPPTVGNACPHDTAVTRWRESIWNVVLWAAFDHADPPAIERPVETAEWTRFQDALVDAMLMAGGVAFGACVTAVRRVFSGSAADARRAIDTFHGQAATIVRNSGEDLPGRHWIEFQKGPDAWFATMRAILARARASGAPDVAYELGLRLTQLEEQWKIRRGDANDPFCMFFGLYYAYQPAVPGL
jgi:hypothetical protein